MADQFTDFKKCISWNKRFDSWDGTFDIESTDTYKGTTFSFHAAPDRSAREVKPYVAEWLYDHVVEFCDEYDIDLNSVIKQKLVDKRKK